jgi:phosphatidylglycerophosphatase A
VNALARVIATWFGLGCWKAPGTAGTLGAVAVAWLLYRYAGFGPLGFGALGLAASAPAIWAAGVVARDSGGKDPQMVVVDEVVGLWITLAGAAHLNWKSWLAAFVLFRIFDIFKPGPVRMLERIPGGAGIVADDLGAGACAALVLTLAGWLNLY